MQPRQQTLNKRFAAGGRWRSLVFAGFLWSAISTTLSCEALDFSGSISGSGEPPAPTTQQQPPPTTVGPVCSVDAQCDDLNACSADVCSAGACTHPSNGSCVCAANTDCDDANPCTDDLCNAGACQYALNAAVCADDGNVCTSDTCSGGVCLHPSNGACACATNSDCDDASPCTVDLCDAGACRHEGTAAACADDGDSCTSDVCSSGQCTHPSNGTCSCALATDCDDSDPCTDDACNAGICEYTDSSAACTDDGSSCSDDSCSGGACTHPANGSCMCALDADCNDSNPCTDDTCAGGACQYVNNSGACADDLNTCTDDVCATGACSHPDNGSCTVDITRITVPARIEAEAYTDFFDTTAGNTGSAACSTTDVDAQATTDVGGGCNVGWTDPGEWLEYEIHVQQSATFDIAVRLASAQTAKSVHVEVDGDDVTGALGAPSTGWQSWADAVAPGVQFSAGDHTLRLALDSGLTNVNYIEVRQPCVPNCSGKECGDNGCQGSCGMCGAGQTCNGSGQCEQSSGRGCKRGVAYGQHSAADMTALSAGIVWWHNWARGPDSGVAGSFEQLGVDFVPMIWDERFTDVGQAVAQIPSSSRFLMGPNEPNFYAQANLSPAQAAALWPQLEDIAAQEGLDITSPALNFCGGGCWETDPFVYFDKFFAACSGCKIDYLAVHWYACTPEALSWYLGEMKRYGLPIWVTEFACGDAADRSLAVQKAYMQQAVQIMENDPDVVRYAWFSGRTTNLPNVNLLGADGQLTELGELYVSLPYNANCVP